MEEKKLKKLDKLSDETFTHHNPRTIVELDENLYSSLYEHIVEAKEQALMNGIQVNAIVINEGIAKTNGFFINTGTHFINYIPPTILGLKMEYQKKLPMDANFMMYHSNEPDNCKKEIAREIIDFIQEWYEDATKVTDKASALLAKGIVDCIIQELKEKYRVEGFVQHFDEDD